MTGNAATEASAPSGAYASVNGLPLYYELHGDGRPLVLLHGGMLTIDLTFGPMLGLLARNHQVIGVELQGHGHTADIDREMTMDNLADDVVALLRYLDVDRADLFGFSLGGIVGLDVAIRYPDLADRLVLASAPYRGDGFYPETRPGGAGDVSRRLPTAQDRHLWEEEYRRVAPDPDHYAALENRAGAMVGAFEGWSADQLRSLRARTLVMIGDTDFVRLEHAIAMAELIPDAELAVLPGCTHMDMTRRPDQVLAMVIPFLDAVS
jgi:pimeloyl-ACP methyl ester carboxylesterase